jgi:hypothetical protein
MSTLQRIRLAAACAFLLLPTVSGCGSGYARPADPDRALSTLREVLDAWKAGTAPGDLASRSNPIHVSDVDWSGGLRLVSYRAEGAGRLVGFDMSYPVVLELKGPRGKTIRKTAVYVVTTAPRLLVLRQEG